MKPHIPPNTAPKAIAERQSRRVVIEPSMLFATTKNAEEFSDIIFFEAIKPTADLLVSICSLEMDIGENEKFTDTLSAAVIALIL